MVAISDPAPPVPAARLEPGWAAQHHMLLWVRSGAALVEPEPGRPLRVEHGHAVWLPAGLPLRGVRTEPGSLAFPLLVPPTSARDAPATDLVVGVPSGWRDWLVHEHVHQVAPITRLGNGVGELLSLLHPHRQRTPPAGGGAPRATHPPVPRSAAAGHIARELVRDPTIGLTVEQWAARVCSSPRSVRRAFVAETGLRFGQWRTRTRLAAAAALLAEGCPVGRAAARSGFRSRDGFRRAFRAEYGRDPVAAARGVTDGSRPVGPRAVSTTWTAPRINDFHVLVWTYRGSVQARVAGTRHDLGQDDAIWLPAGMRNETGSPEAAIGVPIGDVPAAAAEFDAPLRVRFPRSWDTFLLHHSVSCYTGLRPDGHDRSRLLDVVDARLAAERARALPMPTSPAALDAARGVLRTLVSPGRGGSALDAAFRRETGMPLRSWAHAARMRAAVDLLDRGLSPSGVARRVGYAQLSAFSRAFRRFHGMPPSTLTDGRHRV